MNKDKLYFLSAGTAARMSVLAAVLGALLAVLAGALLSGCRGPVSPAGQAGPGYGGYGRLTITVGETGAEQPARTLYPAQSLFARYEVSFASAAATHETVTLTPGTTQTVELLPGVWTITAAAFAAAEGDETAVAAGSATVTIIGGETAAKHITLAPIAGGEAGAFSYAITLPAAAVDSAVLAVTRIGSDGSGTAVADGNIDLTAIPPTGGKRAGTLSLPAGYYLLNIRLTKGDLSAGRTEALHIYPGLTTTAEFTFTDDDLVLPPEGPPDPQPEPGTLAITIGFNYGAITITGSDGSNVLSKTAGGDTPATLTLSVGGAAGYTGVVWYVDGAAVTGGSDGSITLDAAAYDARNHSVTFMGIKDGIPYSQIIPFTVIEDAAWALSIETGATPSPAEVRTALGAALAEAGLTGASPNAALGEAWVVRVSGLALPGGLAALYAGAASALTGDIALDLSACAGASIAYADLGGAAEAQQAIRNRFVALTLPDSVTTLTGGQKVAGVTRAALAGFARLKLLAAPGLTAIGENALKDCIALEKAAFPKVVTVGAKAFYACSGMVEADLPLAQSIGDSAFTDCNRLETGNFPKVTAFGSYAFNSCASLRALTLGNVPPTAALIFNSLEWQTITFTVPAGQKAAYEAAYAAAPWGGNHVTVAIVEGTY